jgi:hypothetical protein
VGIERDRHQKRKRDKALKEERRWKRKGAERLLGMGKKRRRERRWNEGSTEMGERCGKGAGRHGKSRRAHGGSKRAGR